MKRRRIVKVDTGPYLGIVVPKERTTAKKSKIDRETWSLDSAFVKWIVPRLKRFKELTLCYPAKLSSMNEWYTILQDIIDGFEEYSGSDSFDDFNKTKVNKALILFKRWFYDLWW
jgi:hypothetical protein